MNYEEYLRQNPKARLVVKCMLGSMDKKAGLDKQALTLSALPIRLPSNPSALVRVGGNTQRGLQRIGTTFGGRKGIFGRLRGLGRNINGFASAHPYALAGTAGMTGVGLGVAAAGGAGGNPDMRKRGSAQLPAAMRMIAHVIDGDDAWIAKLAACCKKDGKCSKVEHKQMPSK